ncbi:MAG: ferredoxin [Elusimicrobia bacterium RIFOXYA2_FULL_50_26]|nr:MAG: ferredoxin [Elusimicrobia bacterium RIFOXYA2_FULL_50_26]OGS24830.1 MAG: ferredoxin [Elusimicrobia bacterium RIFOXYB2_FULL_50_12]
MKVIVDAELCIGCGLCASNCPEVFEMRDNLAVVINETPNECAQQMVKDCPVEAIKIE